MKSPRFITFGRAVGLLAVILLAQPLGVAQPLGARAVVPNLKDNLDRPLRYRPEGADFVIENGAEFFNRPLYGGNTAFRVDGGDKPEFSLYFPGRGGNLRFGLRVGQEAKWVHQMQEIITRYRPGELIYEIRDPLLGRGALRLAVIAYAKTEGLIVQAAASDLPAGAELIWAYGGASGQRGVRDGDIGTEKVPISEYFQLQPEFCRDHVWETAAQSFTLHTKVATIYGVVPAGSTLKVSDATMWNDLSALLRVSPAAPTRSVLTGSVALESGRPVYLSLQRLTQGATVAEELSTYRAVSSERPGGKRAPPALPLAPAFKAAELPALFAETAAHFASLRQRVSVATPDPFLNAAVGALNVAADAVWDEPQRAIMHGAIAWRTKLLGWRGPYALDALGWHDRARAHFSDWAGRQNTDPIPAALPPPDEASNLARSEAGLHSNGDLSNSHYDMNAVFFDALFRHLRWTGDREFAKTIWPVIERHLAWERRLFRREFGPQKLPLYEAYAMIWASDDLQYSGGGAAHASAYNYFHNVMAAQIAKIAGADPAPYRHEAALIARSMREFLWLPEGYFAESKDWLGLQLVHPSAALWSFYHTMDSGLATPAEASQMTRQVETQIPHLPVRGPGVPPGLYTLATTDWMPYSWSINNVVMGETMHTALGFWQAGRSEDAWRMMQGALLAAMYLGISPGNVGSMSYLDVYRRESQRDFADGSGVMSRAVIEGLFGVRPDALAGVLEIAPGFPATWDHASLTHPDLDFSFQRSGTTDTYVVQPRFPTVRTIRVAIPYAAAEVASVTLNGRDLPLPPRAAGSLQERFLTLDLPAAARVELAVQWSGDILAERTVPPLATPRGMQGSAPRREGTPPTGHEGDGLSGLYEMKPLHSPPANVTWAVVDLTKHFNDRVTEIFHHEYRSPRSPFVSLALPKQGIGSWAGHVNATAEIDDFGLRALAAREGGQFRLPNGVPFATPAAAGTPNVMFTSQWDNFPRELAVSLDGKARHLYLLMAGSTHHMQSRLNNGEVVVRYRDGHTARLALANPTTWWPIEQDYFIDDFQFRRPGPLPVRVDLKTGTVRVLNEATFKGRGGNIPGGAATVLDLALDADRELESLTVRALANDVVIGLMAATLAR